MCRLFNIYEQYLVITSLDAVLFCWSAVKSIFSWNIQKQNIDSVVALINYNRDHHIDLNNSIIILSIVCASYYIIYVFWLYK